MTKVIATIGPGSNKPDILEKLADRKVGFFRINLSHTDENEIEARIKDIIGYGVPVIIDTEGSQVRTGNRQEIGFEEGGTANIHGKDIKCDESNIFLTPISVISKLAEGDLISLDFNSVLLRVISSSGNCLKTKVIIGGKVGGRKAVQIESPTFSLPPFSSKDHSAIKIAKKYGIKHFTLSFMESAEDVLGFKRMYPEAILFSKIESRKGLENFIEIAKASDGILIDRGDLSHQVPLERIPLIQKYILKKVRELGKEAFVATNTLELMASSLKPNRAEVSDIINIILDGATGIALTKEVAVGKYHIETVNMLNALINQIEFVKDGKNVFEQIEKKDYLLGQNVPGLLVKPHGGKLINRFLPNYKGEMPSKNIEIDLETLMDIEQIAVGSFSPLEGFMGSKDFHSVISNMKLANGIVWPLPITLGTSKEQKEKLKIGDLVGLSYNGEIYGILNLEEIYEINKEESAMKIYGSLDTKHPGAKKMLEGPSWLLAGKITLLKKRNSPYKVHELTPQQTRKLFSERGLSRVVGFHTRNVIHRSHEFIQLTALEKGLCDGLFIHPVIGKKKLGDFEAEAIVKSYEKMIEHFYPKSKVIMGTFATYSRYGGPREAIFTALTRKNFGCSHFIVGRDHTGVGNFYGPNDSHKIFDKFSKEELGIELIKFDKVFYSDIEEKHIHEPDFISHPAENRQDISGTQAREMLKAGKRPPEWFMRPEISDMLIDMIKRGEKVFVE